MVGELVERIGEGVARKKMNKEERPFSFLRYD